MTEPRFDVLVVGAGLAGASAATVLGRLGKRVAIVDPQPLCKPVFKAEKIEPYQADLFRRLGLFDGILPFASRIQSVTEAQWGRRVRTRTLEQYGIRYEDMVNAVRQQIPPTVQQLTARVVRLETGPEIQAVTLSTNERLLGRLVIIASGTGGRLQQDLGIKRYMVRPQHSLCSGFDVARCDGAAFSFDSLTHWSDALDESLDYATFFPIRDSTRVNLFYYRDAKDPWVRALAANASAALGDSLPRLSRVTGEWRATSKVETRAIDLYVLSAPEQNGVVFIGDAYQSVCPATGTGVSKVLTDVERLCLYYVSVWLDTPGMAADKTAHYYADPVKVAYDRHSLEEAEYRRRLATDHSFRWWLHRQKKFTRIALQVVRQFVHVRPGGSQGSND